MHPVPNDANMHGYMKGAFKCKPALDGGSQGNKGEINQHLVPTFTKNEEFLLVVDVRF